MHIRTHQPVTRSPKRSFQAKEPKQNSLMHDLVPSFGGAAVGALSGVAGIELAKEYGPLMANKMIQSGAPHVLAGDISAEFAFKALPYIKDPIFQRTVAGLTFAFAGFAVGALVLSQRDRIFH